MARDPVGALQHWDGALFLGAPSGAEVLVRALYALAQRALADAGVQQVTLWRGHRVPGPAGFGVVNPALAPLTSWSTDYPAAAAFLAAQPGVLLGVQVPAAGVCAIAGLSLPAVHAEVGPGWRSRVVAGGGGYVGR